MTAVPASVRESAVAAWSAVLPSGELPAARDAAIDAAYQAGREAVLGELGRSLVDDSVRHSLSRRLVGLLDRDLAVRLRQVDTILAAMGEVLEHA